jgi:hypothetical protein
MTTDVERLREEARRLQEAAKQRAQAAAELRQRAAELRAEATRLRESAAPAEPLPATEPAPEPARPGPLRRLLQRLRRG